MSTVSRRDAGEDKRGSNKDRAARKRWMLSPEAPFGGNSVTVPCVHCGAPLTFEQINQDRILPGGPYAKANLQPACEYCNKARGNRLDWVGPAPRKIANRPVLVRNQWIPGPKGVAVLVNKLVKIRRGKLVEQVIA